MKINFYRREKAAFFSYSSKDADLAAATVDWLKGFAGLDIWLDAKDLDAGRTASTALHQAVRRCRSYITLLTSNSLRSRWVSLEREVATEQAAEHPGFKTIFLVAHDVDPEDIPAALGGITRIHLTGSELDGRAAAKLLASLRPDAGQDETEHDIFVTRTWHDDEPAAKFANLACERLVEAGFRLIGDEPRPDDDPERLRAIISSCTAHFALIPPRRPDDLQWLLQDIAIAETCGVPMIVVVDPKVEKQVGSLKTPDNTNVTFDSAVSVLSADMTAGIHDKKGKKCLVQAVELIEQARKQPGNSYSVFYAKNLPTSERDDINRVVRRITGRKCVYPDEIFGQDVQVQITRRIAQSVATIADVSDEYLDGWVYAGVARGAGRPVDFVTGQPSVSVPFVFQNSRHRPYESHLERVGLVHAALYTHRRHFLNNEVTPWS